MHAKVENHKKQHHIPQSYLKPWCDKSAPSKYEPYVWIFPIDGRIGKKKAPKKHFL